MVWPTHHPLGIGVYTPFWNHIVKIRQLVRPYGIPSNSILIDPSYSTLAVSIQIFWTLLFPYSRVFWYIVGCICMSATLTISTTQESIYQYIFNHQYPFTNSQVFCVNEWIKCDPSFWRGGGHTPKWKLIAKSVLAISTYHHDFGIGCDPPFSLFTIRQRMRQICANSQTLMMRANSTHRVLT